METRNGAVEVKIEGVNLGIGGDPEMLLKALNGQLPVTKTMASPASAKPSLVDGMAPSKGVVMLYGTEGSFKTYVALDLAFHIALGRPWIGRQVTRGDVVYLGAEDPEGLGLRRTAWLLHHGVSESEIAPHFKAIEDTPDFTDRRGKDAANLERLIRFVSPEARLIVIDTAQAVARGVDLNPPHGEAVMGNCEDLAARLNATVLLVHHPRKDSPTVMNGSGVFGRNAENLWNMRHVAGLPFADLDVVRKAKTVGRVGDRFRFHLEYVELPGFFDHGKLMKSSTVSKREQLPDRQPRAEAKAPEPGEAKTGGDKRSRAAERKRRQREREKAAITVSVGELSRCDTP
jgi:hypothetical protein